MKKHLKKIIIISTVLLLVAALLIVYFAFFYKSPEERAAIAAQNAALAAHRALMTAHTASNTELLESDKFFDKPDFMIYEIGGEKIECTPEEADAIYAEFEIMISNLHFIMHNRLGPYDLDKDIPILKKRGAIRFCYNQRHQYIGEEPYTTPVLRDDGSVFPAPGYEWEDFVYDEVLIAYGTIMLAENGDYKLVREKGSTEADDAIELIFRQGGYYYKNFDLAVKKILKIEERFPELLAEEK